MIGHIPRKTRIFIGLAIATLLLTYLAITLSDLYGGGFLQKRSYTRQPKTEQGTKLMDTSDWSEYIDFTHPISFKHPSDWTVTPDPVNEGYYHLIVKIPDSNVGMDIYASTESYLGLDGLKSTPLKVGGGEGYLIKGGLAGIKAGEYYYTFDASLNSEIDEEFNTLLSTVNFK